jgi:hypothetical protein
VLTAFLLGVGLGSASRLALRTGAVALARHRIRGGWLVAVDIVPGLGLVVFGGALGVRTMRDARGLSDAWERLT